MNIGERVARRLKALGLKRAQASKRAGLNPTYVRDLIEQRVTNPRSEHVARLAAVLETTSEWLIEGRGPEEAADSAVQFGKVAAIWDKIAPEDHEHALRALRGFARQEPAEDAEDAEAGGGSKPRRPRKT